MKYGLCCGPDLYGCAAENGLTYVEPALNALRGRSGAETEEMLSRAAEAGVTIDGFNCFFGGNVDLYGDEDAVLSYARENFEIVRALCGRYCVIGSGRFRSVPAGMTRETAADRFAHLLDALGKEAGKAGIDLYLEPLSAAETNMINTFAEGIALCRRIGNPHVGCLIDFFHFAMNGEDLSEFDGLLPGEPAHVHIARPARDRGGPKEEDRDALAAWAAALRGCGYDGRISLECSWGADKAKEIARATSLLRVFG